MSGVSPSLSGLSVGPETQTVKEVFKQMGKQTISTGKNFMIVGAIYAGSECAIESVTFFSFFLIILIFFFPLIFNSILHLVSSKT